MLWVSEWWYGMLIINIIGWQGNQGKGVGECRWNSDLREGWISL